MQKKPRFICRCSSIGKLMSEPTTKSPMDKYNDAIKSLDASKVKYSETKNKETKTANNLLERIKKLESDIKVLKLDKDNIHLSKSCLSVIETWMKEQLGYPYQGISNKYTKKGLLMEGEAIEYAGKYYSWIDAKKNTERRTNNYITGECDVEQPYLISDIKCSWSGDTFPLMSIEPPLDNYISQGQGYMELWDKPVFQLTYVLMDAPEMIIDRECNSIKHELGLDDIEVELYEEVKKKNTFSHLPDELRIKSYLVERDMGYIEKVNEKVDYCNRYVEESVFYDLLERVSKS